MKKGLLLLALVSSCLLVYLHADSKRDTRGGYLTATVVSVEKRQGPSTYIGGNPTDAPLRADDYSYDIGIRLDCDVYVGRYESAIDYLSSVFALNHTVDVRMQKHMIYVGLPSADRDVKMGIVGHQRLREAGCAPNS